MKAHAAGRAALRKPPSPARTDSGDKPQSASERPTRTSSVTSIARSASTTHSVARGSVEVDEPAALSTPAPSVLSIAAAPTTSSNSKTSSASAHSVAQSSASTTAPAAAPGALPARKGCNCKKSRCQKKYCECFQLGLKCTAKCKCLTCLNGNQPHQPHAPEQHCTHAQHTDDSGKENVDQAASTKEAEDSGSGKDDRVRGAFVQVTVESHLASSTGDTKHSHNTAAADPAAAATTAGSMRATQPPSKLSAWRLFPGGGSGNSASVPPLSNAPPIPVQPLAPFTLPAPFEIFHQLKREVPTDCDDAMHC